MDLNFWACIHQQILKFLIFFEKLILDQIKTSSPNRLFFAGEEIVI